MSERKLNTAQIASLLVSTSCGTGFLLGTGELAIRDGMAACLYAVASALGLIALAGCARGLSITGQSVWIRFDRIYGASVGSAVALLSVVWMTGVLAAQIRGGIAILTLAGIDRTSALLIVDGLLVCLSTLRLSWLAAGFAICMLTCNVVLVRALFLTNGLDVWLQAPLRFMDGLRGSTLDHTGSTVASVLLMVVFGADYQQFLVAARTPTMARNGSFLAAGFVFLIGFLPASAVIAATPIWHLQHLADAVQVIPAVLIHTLSAHSATMARTIVIIILLTTTLGAGCSILRAMIDATAALGPRSAGRSIWSRVPPMALSTIVATHGQSLIDMMVDLNMVYITAVGPLLGLTLLNRRISDRRANATMAIGGTIAIALYFLRWTGLKAIPGINPLTASFLPPLLVTVLLWRRTTALQENPENEN